jgi:hypothetical protein
VQRGAGSVQDLLHGNIQVTLGRAARAGTSVYDAVEARLVSSDHEVALMFPLLPELLDFRMLSNGVENVELLRKPNSADPLRIDVVSV